MFEIFYNALAGYFILPFLFCKIILIFFTKDIIFQSKFLRKEEL